jgi:ABC-type nickel/cobalt efflux system permease component RcnA
MTVFSILLMGLLLGVKHATEADHLAAVATLATREATLAQTLRQGVAWGVGHTLSLMGFGGVVFLLGRAISPSLEQALETAVGIMLIVLGADVLRRLLVARIHFHVHRHAAQDGQLREQEQEQLREQVHEQVHEHVQHVHAHSHRGEGAHEASLVMLSLKSLPSWSIGLGYIVVFGVGSIAGMALLSVAIALPLRLSAGYLLGLHRSMTGLVGLFSCALGAYMVVEIGYLRAILFG